MKLCGEDMFDFLHQLLECETTSNGVKATAVYLINCLVHNNGMYVCVHAHMCEYWCTCLYTMCVAYSRN